MTEIFQKATGQDLIKAEIKGKNDLIEFRNCSKITIFGNKFPKINNPTKAFKDRMMFVKFPNYFDDKARVINKENVWLNDSEQRSSILNWALEGLQRLLRQGFFTQTKTQRETEIEFNRVSNPADAFIMERGIFDKSVMITRAANFEAYQDYCEGIGVIADSKILTQAMQKLSPKVRDGWVHKPTKERVWLGFTVKNSEYQSSLEQMPQMPQQNILGKYFESDNSKIKENKTRVPSVASVLTIPTESSSETESADKIPATSVQPVPLSHNSSVSERSGAFDGYAGHLVCVFCGKSILEDDKTWIRDDSTWNKPAHKSCYEAKRAELAKRDKTEES
jgi:putative DNA primase/helicase